MDYANFIDNKRHWNTLLGFDPLWIPDWLFDFQKHLLEWAIMKGRAAIFADCGLGKTPMQLVWAENVRLKTSKPVLILTPLAVSAQTIREANKFQIEAQKSQDGTVKAGITVTNYERLHLFSPEDFGGVVCDESSILKSFDGAYRNEITNFMRKQPYRLLATATAAPNDYIELGTSSEALGYLGYMDMLNRFFKNDQNNSGMRRMYGEAPKWRFKGHAKNVFWRWVSSWARAVRRPSDIGFQDGPFVLPPLNENRHLVEANSTPDGMLFNLPACTLREQRDEVKRTISERCEKIAEILEKNPNRQAVVWCHLNNEGEMLSKIIEDSVEVKGADREERKEEAFLGFANKDIRVLVTKPKIGAWGMNWQNCNHVCFFPSHSYEQYYQAVRRCWRFGQKEPVDVEVVFTEGERRVFENLRRKSKQSDVMFDSLVQHMNDSLSIKRDNKCTEKEVIPSWL